MIVDIKKNMPAFMVATGWQKKKAQPVMRGINSSRHVSGVLEGPSVL
jgi:hypothetical protein